MSLSTFKYHLLSQRGCYLTSARLSSNYPRTLPSPLTHPVLSRIQLNFVSLLRIFLILVLDAAEHDVAPCSTFNIHTNQLWHFFYFISLYLKGRKRKEEEKLERIVFWEEKSLTFWMTPKNWKPIVIYLLHTQWFSTRESFPNAFWWVYKKSFWSEAFLVLTLILLFLLSNKKPTKNNIELRSDVCNCICQPW